MAVLTSEAAERAVWAALELAPLHQFAASGGGSSERAVLWLTRHTNEDLEPALDRESGLLRPDGTSDMRQVLERASRGDAEAAFALEI